MYTLNLLLGSIAAGILIPYIFGFGALIGFVAAYILAMLTMVAAASERKI